MVIRVIIKLYFGVAAESQDEDEDEDDAYEGPQGPQLRSDWNNDLPEMAGSTKLDCRMWLDAMFINTSSKKCSPYITKALIADILSRLPVGFCCVCKSWPVLTSNPQSVSNHHNHAIMATNIWKTPSNCLSQLDLFHRL